MYNLISTRVLSSRVGAQWEEIDAGEMLVIDLFQKYRRIVLTLNVTPGDVVQIIDFLQLKSIYAQYQNTLNILLQTLDGWGFETLASLPGSEIKHVKYSNAFYAGYHLKLAQAGVELPPDADADQKPDVLIYRDEDFDHGDLHRYGLMTVNGFIHDSEVINGNCYIKEAGKSMRVAQNNQVGITSFFSFGEIERLRLTEDMVSVPPGFDTLKDRIRIALPEGYENKRCLLVLGGYLVIPEAHGFWQAGPREWLLDMKRLSYIDRLLESQLYMDMSHLQLSYSAINYKNLNIQQAWGDETLKRYLTMSQSFMIFVDTDEWIFDRHYLRQMKSPGIFTAYQEPTYPLFLGTGRMADYWKVKEGDRWSVTMTDSYRRLWMHHRNNEIELKNIFDQLSFDVPYHFSQGFLMEIGGYKNEV
jgi:hypothetical protein